MDRAIAAAREQRNALGSEHRPNRERCGRLIRKEGFIVPSILQCIKDMHRERAEKALELYEKIQDGEFEVVEVFYSHGTRIVHPNPKTKQVWSHVRFTAKPKNDESGGDASSDDPGFNHGCVLCPSVEKFHPGSEYCIGRSPWYLPSPLCI